MKKCRPARTTSAAILAGGLLFTGPASAAVIFTESFEGAANAFSMPVYGYSLSYTMPNDQTPLGGEFYGHGGAGTVNAFFGGNVLLSASGVTDAQIDAGLASYNFYAQFSTYRTQNDFTEVSISFKDGADAVIGTPLVIGGELFVTGLGASDNTRYPDARYWDTNALAGIIPAGARSVDISLSETRVAAGTNIDGYVDNITLDVSAVPEPGTVALSGLAGLALLARRKRRC